MCILFKLKRMRPQTTDCLLAFDFCRLRLVVAEFFCVDRVHVNLFRYAEVAQLRGKALACASQSEIHLWR